MKRLKMTIPEPCHADWEEMTPQEKGRFCGHCVKTVHALEEYEEAEAQALVEQGACVRMQVNALGQIRLKTGFSSLLIFSGLLACVTGESNEQSSLVGEPAPISEPAPVDNAAVENTDPLLIVPGKPVVIDAHVEENIQGEIVPITESKPPMMGKIAPSEPSSVDCEDRPDLKGTETNPAGTEKKTIDCHKVDN